MTFTVDIMVTAGASSVDAAEAHINFDPLYLTVVDESGDAAHAISPGTALNVILQNVVNNSTGTIDFAAGALGVDKPSGTFIPATVHFRAERLTPLFTPLVFSVVPPRRTNVVAGGTSILGEASGAKIRSLVGSINAPLIFRSDQPSSAPHRWAWLWDAW
jgi:hypothetical protein